MTLDLEMRVDFTVFRLDLQQLEPSFFFKESQLVSPVVQY